MAINDPLGDLLTRIRNAQMRRKSSVSTPGSRLRAHVLDVLKDEGYIRGYSVTEYGNGRTDFEVELKYFDGQPVIREIARVSKPGRRVYAAVDALPRVVVFFVLAGLYESWSLPLAVILVVPMCLSSALAGVALAAMDVNIFVQVGLWCWWAWRPRTRS